MFVVRILGLALMAVAMVGCASNTGQLSAASGQSAGSNPALSLSQYDRVVVRKFTTPADADMDTKLGALRYASAIAANLQIDSGFKDIVVETSSSPAKITSSTLVIDGAVTRWTDGNALLRGMVGMGAGSAYFEADVTLRDGLSNRVLGESKTDRSSWVMGGGIAMSQSADTFMVYSANQLTNGIVEARASGIAPAAGAEALNTVK